MHEFIIAVTVDGRRKTFRMFGYNSSDARRRLTEEIGRYSLINCAAV